ncbi:MAG: phosphoesterase [Acidobacteria bacterium]|nr:phosphoesterase [Acidobacteriota bacterium]
MHLRVLHHNNCFDGACSASVFTRFHRECIGAATRYSYQGLQHKAGVQFEESDFSGDENAIVDFKYSPSPRLTWWFDHHQSAFMTEADRAQFDAQQADGWHAMRHFFDPNYISCTGFIAKIGETKFGWNTEPLKELIHWANIVDGAKYESACSAVEMDEPAFKLTMVIEAASTETIQKIIPLLTEIPLADVLQQPFIAFQLTPLWEQHLRTIDLIRERARVEDGIVTFDLIDKPVEGYNKFIPYYLYPEATYTVGLTRSSFRTKISVGTNPWSPISHEQLANIADICQKYGGGGHARVGAISFPVDRVEDARRAAGEVVQMLRG